MAKSIRDTKKKRGRPRTTGSGVQIGLRWQAHELEKVDAWASLQDGDFSRAEAIRQLVELGLEAKLRKSAKAKPREQK